MPPENKQPSSPIECTQLTTAPPTPKTFIRSFTSPPTLFTVLASEPLRQHIAILNKGFFSSSTASPQPTIMRISSATATPTPTPSGDDDYQTPEATFASTVTVKEEEEEAGEEEEEVEEEDHEVLDAEIKLERGSLASVKQERERSVTMAVEEETSSSSTIASSSSGTEGERRRSIVKQEPQYVPVPVDSEARYQPRIFSPSTDEEESDRSFLSQEQHHMFTASSQRSELGEQLSAEVFGNGLSLDATASKGRSFSRTKSDLELPLASPILPAASTIATQGTQATKYKWRTVTITKEVLVIDLEDSDDDGGDGDGGGGGGGGGASDAQQQQTGERDVKVEAQGVEYDEGSTQAPSTTEPSATVLGKRVAISQDWDDEIECGDLDDGTADRRFSKRAAIAGSENCPVELLDSDSDDGWGEDFTFVGPKGESSAVAAVGPSSGSSSWGGSGSGSVSGVSQRGPQAIVEEHTIESNVQPETQSLSQQLKVYKLQQQERYIQNQAGIPRQQTPVAAPPPVINQSPVPARNSRSPQPFTGTPPPHYQYISDDDMDEELPPAYAVQGPQPLKLSYPSNMTSDGFEMTATQQHVLDLVVNERQNVFFTGSAGTGKSVLLRELILRLRSKHSRWRNNDDDWDSQAAGHVAVTASTGIAACNIRGCTLHSFAGIGLGTDPVETLYFKIRNNKNLVNRWKSTKVLLIDEVSMISAELMDLIEELARRIRNDRRPWGGIQVVLVGDFFQLPPVEKVKEPRFCFQSAAWGSIEKCIQLEKVFRQRDHAFVDALNQLRVGIMSQTTLSVFKRLNRPVPEVDGIKPTELFPLRKQVDEANASMLVKLPGNSHFYIAIDGGVFAAKMETNCIAPTVLELKVNAQVMLLKNQSGGAHGLVNGSVGVVIEMTTEAACNVRTSQDGKALPSLNTPGELLPKVRFFNHDNTGLYTDMVLGREEWTVEAPALVRNENQEEEYRTQVLGSRVQIPLCLAWAMSIHKSQGQTLPKVKVDLGRVFEKGQAYVALSRATTLDGLQVVNFDERRVMVHQKVINFYEHIGGVP